MIRLEASDLFLCAHTEPKASRQGQFVRFAEGVLTPEETQRLFLKCGEGHVAMILNKTRLLDALAVFTAPTVLGPFEKLSPK
jgi:hypothetical protein